jgi:hypothetical protein
MPSHLCAIAILQLSIPSTLWPDRADAHKRAILCSLG